MNAGVSSEKEEVKEFQSRSVTPSLDIHFWCRVGGVTSNSLAIDSVFSDSGVAVRMVGKPISMGITASIPKVSANGEMSVGFRAVVM